MISGNEMLIKQVQKTLKRNLKTKKIVQAHKKTAGVDINLK